MSPARVASGSEALVAVVSEPEQCTAAQGWAERNGRRVLVMLTPSAEPQVVAAALSRIRPRMLVAGDGDLFEERRADALRRALDCPLVIVC
jgi:hypothetical protein